MRVSDSNPDMLRYLAEQGISLGDRLAVSRRQPFGGPVFVSFGDRELALGGELARAMRIDLDEVPVTLRRRIPALEGAAAEGASIAIPDPAGPSALDQLLAKGRLRARLAMLGPAFVAAIAYVDPGNFATNLQGGPSTATCCCGWCCWPT